MSAMPKKILQGVQVCQQNSVRTVVNETAFRYISISYAGSAAKRKKAICELAGTAAGDLLLSKKMNG